MSGLSSPTRFYNENHLYDQDERVRSPLSSKMHDFENFGSPQRKGKEDLDMYVPDRILVVGQDQYYGTAAPPRELRLESSVRPHDAGLIRVETPPRVISLSEHRFPTVGEDDDLSESGSPPSIVTPFRPITATPKKPHTLATFSEVERSPFSTLNNSEIGIRGLPPTEELTHLRRQMAKLNRRLMAIELENIQRQQREKYLLAIGLGYYLVKFIFWLNK